MWLWNWWTSSLPFSSGTTDMLHLLSQRQESKDGSWRKSLHLLAYRVTQQYSLRGWMRGELDKQKEGELEWNSWALLQVLPILSTSKQYIQKHSGFALGIENLPRGWETTWRALGCRSPCQKLVRAQAFLHPTPLLRWATHASINHTGGTHVTQALCACSKSQRL